MKYIQLFFIFLFVLNSGLYSVSKTISNPQSIMTGARGISLGGSPILEGDISNVIVNPSSISDIDQLPFSITSQKLLGEFSYLLFSIGMPKTVVYKKDDEIKRIKFGFGLSYANINLKDIPETEIYNDLPYQTGSFNAGFNVIHLSAGTTFYEMYSLNKISAGTALKFVNQYISSESASTFGIDFGVIATKYIDYLQLDSVEFGGAIQNLMSPAIKFGSTGNEASLPLSLYLGSKLNLFNERLALLTSLNDLGLSFGIEYELEEGMHVRSSSNFDYYSLGAGLVLDNISTGIANYGLKGRVDFNFTHPKYPMNEDPTYILSIASLGRSLPKQPQILRPARDVNLISKDFVSLSGVGPKNTTVRLYINDRFYQTTLSNKFGRWKIDKVVLLEGINTMYIKSYDISKDFSVQSNEVVVISDTEGPQLDVRIIPDKSTLEIYVDSDESLSNLSVMLNEEQMRMKKDSKSQAKVDPSDKIKTLYKYAVTYIGRSDLPENLKNNSAPPNELNYLEVFATDESGNSLELDKIPFFGSITSPLDKTVHYNDTMLIIGQSSSLLNNVYINKTAAYIDPDKNFSFPIDLEPGKNLIETTFETVNSKVLNFYTRVLRLVSYPDMNPKVKGRREIEFLSTLGILHGDDDGYFYPTRVVSRQYITKLMVLAMEEPVEEEVAIDLFSDVPKDHPFAKYIQAGVNSGLVFAFPDGKFRPDQELTLSEAIYLLSNAGVIDYEEVEDADRLVSRAQLAEFLAYTPRFERKIEKLIDWEKGYSKPE
jgi:hypothetical protein